MAQHLCFKPRMSRSKHKSNGDVAGPAKKHQAITMETKLKIIERAGQGEKMVHMNSLLRSVRSSLMKTWCD